MLDPAAPDYRPYHGTPPFPVDMLGDNVLATAMGVLIDGHFGELRRHLVQNVR